MRYSFKAPVSRVLGLSPVQEQRARGAVGLVIERAGEYYKRW